MSLQAELAWQNFFDLGGNLGCLNLNSLVIEMDVVAVVFRMAAQRGVEIVGRNLLRSHDFRSDAISGRDSIIRVFRLGVVSDAFAIAQWSCCSPNQTGLR